MVQATLATMRPARVFPAVRRILATEEEWSATSIPATVCNQNALRTVTVLSTSQKNVGSTSTMNNQDTTANVSVVTQILTAEQTTATTDLANYVLITIIVMMINPATKTPEPVESLKK